ncbi:MAG: radical SAM family heme chaperone HemW [Dehalococcoidia bacterium]
MKPLSVYVHIPFCTLKCGYCDFNVYAGLGRLKDVYADAVISEVAAWRGLLSARQVVSIGFGGGTPGEMPPTAIAAIIDAIRATADVATDAEVSLEANPGTTPADAFGALRAAGVNRISLGAQSFHDDELRFLDRIHAADAIEASVRLARDAGFDNVNLDLIYGLPGQTERRWLASLDRALALAPEHLSLYALTVEERTPLAVRIRRGLVDDPDPDLAAHLYEVATDVLAAAGYEQYELSNWCRPGYRSRHNLAYWTDREYVGLGAGAHGYIEGARYENVAHPREYIRRCADPVKRRPYVAASTRYEPVFATDAAEWVALRLRLLEGFPPLEFEARFGSTLDDVAGAALARCEQEGLIERAEGRLQLTRRGRLFHGEVAARVLAQVQQRAARMQVASPSAGG